MRIAAGIAECCQPKPVVLRLRHIPAKHRFEVFKALRSPRNRICLHILIFVLLANWIFMLVSATCAMPSAGRAVAAAIMPADCAMPDSHAAPHAGHAGQNCSLQPCPDSPPNPALAFKAEKPQMPLLILCLAWLAWHGYRDPAPRNASRSSPPPGGRRVPLIYRFCVLLN
jgi:hypothetical protein